MKKALIIALVLVLVSGAAYAGILSTAKDWVLDNILATILTALFALVGGFFGGTAWGKAILKAKLPIQELVDVGVKVHNARRPSSPGGRSITDEEKAAILKEVDELIQAIVTTFGKGK